MIGYQIQNSSLRCARTGRDLKPGERFYSVLYDRDGKWVREDLSQEAWQGPPPDAFSFWLSRVPPREQSRRPLVDDEVLFTCFERLADDLDPQKVCFRYIIALFLMRRKRLKFEDAEVEHGQEILILRDPRSRTCHRLVNPQLSEAELLDVEHEVEKLLGIL